MNVRRFSYRAADASGVVHEGEVDAESEQGAIDLLRRRALWVTELWPKQKRARIRQTAGVPAGALATVTRALSTLLASGVPLDEALTYAATQSPAHELREAFVAVRAAVRNGRTLSDAFRAHTLFPSLFAALSATGEATGTLDTALARLAEHLERTDELRTRIRAALLYPVLLAAAAIVGVTIIMLVVIPRFSVLLQQAGGDVPWSTGVLMATSTTVTSGWPFILVCCVVAAVGWRSWIARDGNVQRWHATRLAWPVTGELERLMGAARYTRTLALALPSGVNLLSAMKLARGTVGNAALRLQLEDAEAQVRDGSSLSAATAQTLPPLAVQLLSAGEASGALAVLSSRASDALDGEVQRQLSRAVTLIEPILILGFGSLIGFVALGLLQAIYGVNASTL